MPRGKKQTIKSMANAKKALMLKVDIGELAYEFESDIFDLDNVNMGILNEQITKIPGLTAFVGEAHAEAERVLARRELEFDVWKAKQLTTFFADSKTYKSETDKLNNLKSKFSKEYVEHESEVLELRKLTRVLRVYEKGIQAKLELAQTMSANIRTERDAYTRNYDKGNTPSGQLGKKS